MRIRLFSGCKPGIFLMVAALAPVAMGQEARDSFVRIVDQVDGEPLLVVRYPWKIHDKPSIELRMMAEGEEEGRDIRPLRFRQEHMQGVNTVLIFRCQDQSSDTPQNARFVSDGIDFHVLADRNSLGQPAASVGCMANVETLGDTVPVARAIFPLLEPWAIDDQILFLEPPIAYFAKPGRMKVWLMRGKQIIWSEMADWPGMIKAEE